MTGHHHDLGGARSGTGATGASLPRDDRGVSVILGAMLLAGILVSGMLVYQVTVVPDLDAAAEAAHSRQVASQLSLLKSELDRQLENRTHAPVATPVSLGAQQSTALSTTGAEGALRFEPEEAPVEVWSHRLLVQEVNGSRVGGVEEEWKEAGGAAIEEIVAVHSLRLKIEEVSRSHTGDSITLNVLDAGGDPAGSFTVQVEDPAGTDYHVRYIVEASDGEVIYDDVRPFHHTTTISPLWVDVLKPEYRFDRVLGEASTPYELSVAEDGLSGSYAITYEKATVGGGTRTVSGGGVVKEDFHRRFQGGSLVYDAENENFERQEYALSNGALVLSQRQGAVFKVHPNFEASLPDNLVSLRLTVPSLVGEAASVTGGGSGTVYTSAGAQTWITGKASNLSLEVRSGKPELWADLWRSELSEAGLSEGTAYTVTTGAAAAKLEVWGLLHPDPASTEYDLLVALKQTDVNVEVEG